MSTRPPARLAPALLLDHPTQPDLLQHQVQAAAAQQAAQPGTDHDTASFIHNVLGLDTTSKPADRRTTVAWMRILRPTPGRCSAIDCASPAKPGMFMCWPHWRRVPKVLRGPMFRSAKAGDWSSWVVTARLVVAAVAAKEGKVLLWQDAAAAPTPAPGVE